MLYYVICENQWYRMVHSQHRRFCDAVNKIKQIKSTAKMKWEYRIDEEKEIDEEDCERSDS
jgi:hypothetical protein